MEKLIAEYKRGLEALCKRREELKALFGKLTYQDFTLKARIDILTDEIKEARVTICHLQEYLHTRAALPPRGTGGGKFIEL